MIPNHVASSGFEVALLSRNFNLLSDCNYPNILILFLEMEVEVK